MALDEEEKKYLDKAKSSFNKIAIGVITTVLLAAGGSIWRSEKKDATQDTVLEVVVKNQDNMQVQIQGLKDKVATIAIDPAVANESLKSINTMLKNIQEDQRLMKAQQNKMYDYIFELSREKKK